MAGGIASYTSIAAKGLAGLGQNVTVIAQGAPVVEWDGPVRVVRTMPYIVKPLCQRPLRWLRPYERFTYLGDWFGWSYAAYRAIRELNAVEPVDLIEAPDFRAEGFACAQWLRNKTIVKLHSPAELVFPLNNANTGQDFRYAIHLERTAAHHAALLTSPSRAMAFWVQENWKIGQSQIQVVPYPVDEDLFVPCESNPDAPPVLLYVGRLEKNKGVLTLLEAFSQTIKSVPEAKLRLVGNENYYENGVAKSLWSVVKLDTQVADRIEIVGRVPNSQLPEQYQNSSVCVVPTLGFDNFPYTCLEAMSCGRPVVGTGSGGMAEMIEDGVTGHLVPPGDVGALADALIRVLGDAAQAKAMGFAARTRVEQHYSKRVVLDQMCRMYKTLL